MVFFSLFGYLAILVKEISLLNILNKLHLREYSQFTENRSGKIDGLVWFVSFNLGSHQFKFNGTEK